MKTEVFVQWKATDVFGDFYCECEEHTNFEGYFAYYLKCCKCGNIYKMPTNFKLKKIEDDSTNFIDTFEME